MVNGRMQCASAVCIQPGKAREKGPASEMVYTKENTLNDILGNEVLGDYLYIGIAKGFVNMIPEDKRDMPLFQVAEEVKTRFGPFPVDMLLNAANQMLRVLESGDYEFLPIWCETKGEGELTVGAGDETSVFLITKKSDCKDIRPATVFVPGGAYMLVALLNEGIDAMLESEKYGYRGFALYYRVKPNVHPVPQMDMAFALMYLRKNAARFNIDPDRIATIGFSAGAHLAGIAACHHEDYKKLVLEELAKTSPELAESYSPYSAKADLMGFGYPVISFSVDSPWGKIDAVAPGREDLKGYLSIEENVSEDFPPTFCFVCENDRLVRPYTGILFANALKEKNIPYHFTMYPEAMHGIGLGAGTSAEVWPKEMFGFFGEIR